MSEPSKKLLSEAARLMGSRTSERKKKASAENGQATRFKMKPLDTIPCDCTTDKHKSTCLRGRAIRRRARRENIKP